MLTARVSAHDQVRLIVGGYFVELHADIAHQLSRRLSREARRARKAGRSHHATPIEQTPS